MRFHQQAFLLLVAASSSQLVCGQGQRTEIEVEYEYRLEVNGVSTVGTPDVVLTSIDQEILSTLQETLPNGGTTSEEEEPNVRFETIDSNLFSACFTKSERCSLIKSKLVVSYLGEKPQHSLEMVALNLVQKYLKDFSMNGDANEGGEVLITYLYPLAVSTLAQFQIAPVLQGRMNTTQIAIVQDSFVEVFGAITAAIEGDTEIINAQFLYQDLFAMEDPETGAATVVVLEENTPLEKSGSPSIFLEIVSSSLLATDLLINGICRECTSVEFGEVVNAVIEENLQAYKVKLQENGALASSEYFADLTTVTFDVPELPSKLDPIEDDTIYDFQTSTVDSTVPWFLWMGLAIGVVVLLFGSYCIHKETQEFAKEDVSTSESEFEIDGDEEESREDEEAGSSGLTEVDYVEGTTPTYDLEETQVETVTNQTDDGNESKYEVYVF
jgi:hypothetical protein